MVCVCFVATPHFFPLYASPKIVVDRYLNSVRTQQATKRKKKRKK